MKIPTEKKILAVADCFIQLVFYESQAENTIAFQRIFQKSLGNLGHSISFA